MNTVAQVSVPNTQVWLSKSVLETLTQDFYQPMQEDGVPPVLHWPNVRQWIDAQKWMRLVERCDEGHWDTLVICSFFRLAKDKRTQVVKMQRKTLKFDKQGQPQCRWVKASYIPNFKMQKCKDSLLEQFKDAFCYALDAMFQDWVKQGVVIIEQPTKREKTPAYSSTFDSFDETSRSVYLVDIDQKWGRNCLISRFTAQTGLLTESAKSASRYLYKHLWDFVDKERLSLLMKIRQCALSEVSFDELYRLTQVKLDAQHFNAHTNWLPWLTFIKKDASKHFHQPNLFSYDYLLPLLPKGTSKKLVRKINRQPRCLQVWLIRYLQNAPMMLPFLEHLKAYPSSIVLSLAERVIRELDRFDECMVADVSPLIGYRWAQYFASMIGKVKPRKQKPQWQRAMNQCNDVLYWALRTNATIHKNQTWYSLTRQHDRWVEALNAARIEDEQVQKAEFEEKLKASWAPTMWESFDSKGIAIEEITTGQRLLTEGQEMEHCVFGYFNDCANARYRVFSLIDEESHERATLGLSQDPVTHQCSYDQLRSWDNGDVSPLIERVAGQLIKRINVYEIK